MGRAHDIDAYCSREREGGWEERMISMCTAVEKEKDGWEECMISMCTAVEKEKTGGKSI